MPIQVNPANVYKSIYFDQPLHSRVLQHANEAFCGPGYKLSGFEAESIDFGSRSSNLVVNGDFAQKDTGNTWSGLTSWVGENTGGMSGNIVQVYGQMSHAVRLYYNGSAGNSAGRVSIKNTSTFLPGARLRIRFSARSKTEGSNLRVLLGNGTTTVSCLHNGADSTFPITTKWGVYHALANAIQGSTSSSLAFALYDDNGSVTPVEIDIDDVHVSEVSRETAAVHLTLNPGSFLSNGIAVNISNRTHLEIPYEVDQRDISGGIPVYGWTETNAQNSPVFIDFGFPSIQKIIEENLPIVENGGFEIRAGNTFQNWEFYTEGVDLAASTAEAVTGSASVTAVKITRTHSGVDPETEKIGFRTPNGDTTRIVPPGKSVRLTFSAKSSINGVKLNASLNGPTVEETIFLEQALTTTWTTYSKIIMNTPDQGASGANSYLDIFMKANDGESIYIDNLSLTYDPDVQYKENISNLPSGAAILGYIYFPKSTVNHIQDGALSSWTIDELDHWDIFEGNTSSVTKVARTTSRLGYFAKLTYNGASAGLFDSRCSIAQGLTGNGIFPETSQEVMVEFEARPSSAGLTLSVWSGDGATYNEYDIVLSSGWNRYAYKVTTAGASDGGISFVNYKNVLGSAIDLDMIKVYPVEQERDAASRRRPKWIAMPSGKLSDFVTPDSSFKVHTRTVPLGTHWDNVSPTNPWNYYVSLSSVVVPDVTIESETVSGTANITVGYSVYSNIPIDNDHQHLLFVAGKLLRPGLDYHITDPGRAVLWARDMDAAGLAYTEVTNPFYTGSFGVTQLEMITGSVDIFASDKILFQSDHMVYMTGSAEIQISPNHIGKLQGSQAAILMFADGRMMSPDKYLVHTESGKISVLHERYNAPGVTTTSLESTFYTDATGANIPIRVSAVGVETAYVENLIRGRAQFRDAAVSYSSLNFVSHGNQNNHQFWSDGTLAFGDHIFSNYDTYSPAILHYGVYTPQLFAFLTGSDRVDLSSFPLEVYSRPLLRSEVDLPAGAIPETHSRMLTHVLFESAAAGIDKTRIIRLPRRFGQLDEVTPAPSVYDGITLSIYNSPSTTFASSWQSYALPPLNIKPSPRHFDKSDSLHEFANDSKIFNGNYFVTIHSLMGYGPLVTDDHVYPYFENVPASGQHPHKEDSVFIKASLKVDLLSDVPEGTGDAIGSAINLTQVNTAGETQFQDEAKDVTGTSFFDPDTGRPTLSVSESTYMSQQNPIVSYAGLESMMMLWADALGLVSEDVDGKRSILRKAGVSHNNNFTVNTAYGSLLSSFAKSLLGINDQDSLVTVVEKFLDYRAKVGIGLGYGSGMMWGSCAFDLENGKFEFKPLEAERYPRSGQPPYTERNRLTDPNGVYREYHDDFSTNRTNYSTNATHWGRKTQSRLDEGWCKIPSGGGDPEITDILSRNRSDSRYNGKSGYAWYTFDAPDRSVPFDYGWYAGNVGFVRPNKDLEDDKETYRSHLYQSTPWTAPYAQANRGTGVIEFNYLGDDGYPAKPGVNNYTSGKAVYLHRKGLRNNIICFMNPMRELHGSKFTTWREDANSSFHSTDYYYHWGDTAPESAANGPHPKCVEYFEYKDGFLAVRPYVNYSHFVEPVYFFVLGQCRGLAPRFAGHSEGATGQREENFYTVRNKDLIVTRT